MKLLKTLLSYFPTAIPTGKTAFDAWLDSIVDLTGPIADADSLKWVISNEVMRIKSGQDHISKRTLVRTLRKFAANQIAAACVNECKERQEARAKKQAEETAANQGTGSSDGEKTA